MPEIAMIPLTSSNVNAAGYDDATGTMRVEFQSGGLYEGHVPRDVYEGLISSRSPGSYYFKNIRSQFAMERV